MTSARVIKLASTCTIWLTSIALGASLTACTSVKLDDKDKKTTTTTTTTQQAPAPVAALTGDWKVEFGFNGAHLSSTIHLEQQGNSFKGTGTDDANQMAFVIENGKFDNGQVSFFKKYPNAPSIQYDGKYQATGPGGSPSMDGDYTTSAKGQIINDSWRAEKLAAGAQPPPQQNGGPGPNDQMAQQQQQGGQQDQGQGGPGDQQQQQPDQQQQEQQQPPPPQNNQWASWPPEKAPDLSGKWEVGYEYNFKTMHSSMYVEQEGAKISGHGVDINTKEKFNITGGSYKFPDISITRHYDKVEKKGKIPGSPERIMTFKGKVSVVTDKDYQGPYMSGKTQGGGMWEAQLLK